MYQLPFFVNQEFFKVPFNITCKIRVGLRSQELKQSALENGALNSGISGSGPSIFALCKGIQVAEKVKDTFNELGKEFYTSYDVHCSKVNNTGVVII